MKTNQTKSNMKTNFNDYTVKLSKNPEYYGSSCTEEDADRIFESLSKMLDGEFPGIRVEEFVDGLTSSKTEGPDSETVETIDRWIEENWTAAL